MSAPTSRFSFLVLLLVLVAGPLGVLGQPADPGWPRVFKKDKKQLTVYQPQVDYWKGYTNLHFRCAIAVKGVTKDEKFGVAEVEALTVTDHGARVVAIVPVKRDLRFANVPESDLAKLRRTVDELNPPGQAITLSLDRVLACLNPANQPVQTPVEVNLEPPRIFSSTQPAILVIFMGTPQFRPVETNRTDLLFAVNANWDVLYDTATRQYFLLQGEGWLTAPDPLKGPWVPARSLPPSLYSLPQNETWAAARSRVPGKPLAAAPVVFTSTEPAELILTEGVPAYSPVQGTSLLRVSNTDSVLFLHAGDGKLYLLVAGRWFRGGSLNGPWSAASRDLPPDFSRIADDDPSAFVKASVPGTRDAQDAVLLASIPATTEITLTNVTANVTYTGTPQFVTITNTVVQYAVNTPSQVFLVSGGYYWCSAGIWYCASSPTGPWAFCTSIPPAIYTIPPTNPNHNVTYVTVQTTTPTTVVYSQTSGYSGEYVAATGVLMFGAGMLVGAAIAHDDHHYYYPPYPCHYSYGCGAVYHHGSGGFYYRGGAAYGPYGGAGVATAYNPATGGYQRAAYAYGPYGSASARAGYNPTTGAYARGGQVSTAYGSAGRAAGYNPYTGTYAQGAYRSSDYGTATAGRSYNPYTGTSTARRTVSTDQGSASRGAAYNSRTGQGAVGGTVSGDYGSAAGYRTTSGAAGFAWDTENGEGAVGKTRTGDIYASNGDTVYKKDDNGNWSQNSGNGWESAERPQSASTSATSRSAPSQSATTTSQRASSGAAPSSSAANRSTSRAPQAAAPSTSSSSWNQQRQNLESQAQARQYGNQRANRSSQYQSSGANRGGYSSGASSYGGGRSTRGGTSRGGRR